MSTLSDQSENTQKSKSGGKKGSSSARKRMSRLMAVQAIYQILMTDTPVDTVLLATRDKNLRQDVSDTDEFVDHDDALFLSIVRSWQAHQEQVITILKEVLKGKNKVPEQLLMANLMAGVAELLAHADIDAPIIIKDYMTIADSFYSGEEQKLVNAILDRVNKVVR